MIEITVPKIAVNDIFSLYSHLDNGSMKIGVKAIRVDAIPT